VDGERLGSTRCDKEKIKHEQKRTILLSVLYSRTGAAAAFDIICARCTRGHQLYNIIHPPVMPEFNVYYV